MRLIDADALEYKHIQSADNKGYIVVHAGDIDGASTVYDLDKVIKKLQELKEECSDPLQEYEPEYFIDRAIEIAKSGGVGNSD